MSTGRVNESPVERGIHGNRGIGCLLQMRFGLRLEMQWGVLLLATTTTTRSTRPQSGSMHSPIHYDYRKGR
jgi:hypothetical protein